MCILCRSSVKSHLKSHRRAFSRPLKSRHVRPRWTLAIARLDGADERIPTRGRMPTFGAFWSTRTEPRPEHIFEFDGSARRSLGIENRPKLCRPWPVSVRACRGRVAGHPLGRLPTSRPISGPIADPVSAGFDVVPREVNEGCLDLCF